MPRKKKPTFYHDGRWMDELDAISIFDRETLSRFCTDQQLKSIDRLSATEFHVGFLREVELDREILGQFNDEELRKLAGHARMSLPSDSFDRDLVIRALYSRLRRDSSLNELTKDEASEVRLQAAQADQLTEAYDKLL